MCSGLQKIIDEFYSLVNPETHFDYFNVKLTGINEEKVANAPTFPELWEQIEPVPLRKNRLVLQ
ncbi:MULTISPECIES: exonuclease domain-containing protein [Pseudobutyrivibrio]|uniref:exonuclease domain-containing protein n=1 Tax=Pseudobutyrivibrio TaxID=46205 RepID=UPI003B5104B1